ncbi:hypothetical protein [Nocardia sp. NPDC052566]|uniref:F0F1 ATP synthase subunit B family protein n=1 Tax=Nocardia sp. NPDC052566 TaxID=3364330 RepID=UPI0037C7AB94
MNHSEIVLAEGIFHLKLEWPVLLSQLVSFGVILYGLYRFWPLVHKNVIDKPRDLIERQLQESDHAKARLAEAKQAYDTALAEAQRELELLRKDAREDSVYIIEQMRAAAAAEVARVRKQGRDQVVLFHKQVIRKLEEDLTASVLAKTTAKVHELASAQEYKVSSIEKVLDDLETMPPNARRRTQSQWN